MSVFFKPCIGAAAGFLGTATLLNSGRYWSNRLSVERMDFKDRLPMADLLEGWEKVAREKERLAEEAGDSRNAGRFAACSFLANENATMFRIFEDSEDYERTKFYVCRHSARGIQGMISMRTVDDELYIANLVGHPNNIRSPVNDREDRVVGVGTALMRCALKTAYKEGVSKISGGPLSSAAGFYEKVAARAGFQIQKRQGWDNWSVAVPPAPGEETSPFASCC